MLAARQMSAVAPARAGAFTRGPCSTRDGIDRAQYRIGARARGAMRRWRDGRLTPTTPLPLPLNTKNSQPALRSACSAPARRNRRAALRPPAATSESAGR
jgi:hypothetical protein